MTYILFGAYALEPRERGVECDNWLPIIGDIRLLDDVHRLKKAFEGCVLRVFEGIGNGIGQQRNNRNLKVTDTRRNRRVSNRDDIESGEEEEWETEDTTNLVLSSKEVVESNYMTDGIVDILNQYADEREAVKR